MQQTGISSRYSHLHGKVVMKHISRFILALFTLCMGSTLNAQQTYYNVPSSVVTPEGKFYFQANTFLTNTLDRTSINGMYGINKDTEIGANLLHYDYGDSWVGLGIQHRETLTADHNLTIGGTYYLNSNGSYYAYALVTANKLISKAHINGGLYYGNASMFGTSTIGFMAGFDYPVINDKIRIKGEFMTGEHWMNGLNFGAEYAISPVMKAGVGINLVKSNNGPSPFILQLHYAM
ncbi:hypothetical protein EBV26_06025 [bacterium]|nr:hypothetical protein [bacterium]